MRRSIGQRSTLSAGQPFIELPCPVSKVCLNLAPSCAFLPASSLQTSRFARQLFATSGNGFFRVGQIAFPPHDYPANFRDRSLLLIFLFELPDLLYEAEYRVDASWLAFHCADHQPAQNRFGLRYFPNAEPFAKRDLLVQDFLEERLQILTAFWPAAGIARLSGFEAGMHWRSLITNCRQILHFTFRYVRTVSIALCHGGSVRTNAAAHRNVDLPLIACITNDCAELRCVSRVVVLAGAVDVASTTRH